MLHRLILMLLASLLLTLVASGQTATAVNDSTKDLIAELINRALSFSDRMPREKVSVHLDNTGYFKNDKIWFQCYVVDGISNTPTTLSHTLYVELLNPRGMVISLQILKISGGRCHGAFDLSHMPFYSGFYEIRAYTKYMLNFGDAGVFSRAIPVFDLPKVEGDFADKKMVRNISRYPGKRPTTKAGPGVSMRFFPEGGALVDNVYAKVAFEIIGKNGIPLNARGRIVDKSTGLTVATFNTIHEGRGVFEFTPHLAGQYKAVVICDNADGKHEFSLPAVSTDGIGLQADIISNPDSLSITIRPGNTATLPQIAGMALSLRGAIWSYSFVDISRERTLRLPTSGMPSGVAIITIFAPDGHTLAERMVFVDNGGHGTLSASIVPTANDIDNKMALDITAMDAEGNPAAMLPLSVSVTDGDNAVDYQGSILSDLLLGSEIKGYIRNPMQYFRSESDSSRIFLDLLMMVSGWRHYSWETMSAAKPLDIKYFPEDAIDMDGTVVSFVRGIPKPDVDISVMVSEKGKPDSLRHNFSNLIVSDSLGRFHMSYDFYGKWDLLTSVSEKGKRKDHRIILDRLFSPEPRRFEPAELQIESYRQQNIPTPYSSSYSDSIDDEAETDRLIKQAADSLKSKSIVLGEVVVKGTNRREVDIYKARSKSLAYYDVPEELGDLADKGKVVGQDLFSMLKNINPNFHSLFEEGREVLYYKGKLPLFVINYQPTYLRDSLNYTLLYLESIKSIFVTEDISTMARYADPMHSSVVSIDKKYSCAVLIETFDDRKGPAGKGTRLQTIEGYTLPEEFQNIDDKILLDDPDFRRTLYWNPTLVTGSDGKAHVEFFSTPTCRNPRISIHGVDAAGSLFAF